jgi:aminomethyltransferase
MGYEIYYPWSKTSSLWKEFIEMGAHPAGLGARDLLRIEMGYPLYGHEINEDIFPLDAGLNRFIDWEKDFIGKTALLQYKESGVARKLACFVADSRRSPRAEQKILSLDHKEIGIVTSGTFSPALSQGAGLAFVPADLNVGQEIFFGAEKNLVPARIVSRPIYKEGTLKQ